MADADGVDHAEAPAVRAGQRRPVQVKAPTHSQLRERQQHRERRARKRGHGADLDEGGLAHDAAQLPPRLRPGSVRAQAVGRLGQLQLEALAQEEEAVEKAVRQLHVVVDHQQPVVAICGVLGQQPVEILELAAGARAVKLHDHVVARAQQLRARALCLAPVLGALDAEHEHAAPRGLLARGQRQS